MNPGKNGFNKITGCPSYLQQDAVRHLLLRCLHLLDCPPSPCRTNLENQPHSHVYFWFILANGYYAVMMKLISLSI